MFMKGDRLLSAMLKGEGLMSNQCDEPHALRDPWNHILKNGVRSGNPTLAPRCGAQTRFKQPCKAPAMKNGRCRMHGGKSTGPKTIRGKARSRRANWKHGDYSSENKILLKQLKKMLTELPK